MMKSVGAEWVAYETASLVPCDLQPKLDTTETTDAAASEG